MENNLPFRPYLLILHILTNKLKIFSTNFKTFTNNTLTVKDTLHFAEEIIDQQPDSYMGSLDLDPLFIDIALHRAIQIYTNKFFKYSVMMDGKHKFKGYLQYKTITFQNVAFKAQVSRSVMFSYQDIQVLVFLIIP